MTWVLLAVPSFVALWAIMLARDYREDRDHLRTNFEALSKRMLKNQQWFEEHRRDLMNEIESLERAYLRLQDAHNDLSKEYSVEVSRNFQREFILSGMADLLQDGSHEPK